MKNEFHDPIKAKPKEKNVKTPWNFASPSYDDRLEVCAGTHYGTGHNQPVGSVGQPKKFADVLPMTCKTVIRDNYDKKVEILE